MSGPNTNFDPVQVTPLNAEEVDRMVAEALQAIASAGDTAALKAARIEHNGDRSPLALANREIGALPPQARKEAGQRIGRARGQVNKAIAEREAELKVAELQQRLVAESVDMTVPVDQGPVGAAHPVTDMDLMADVFVSMGWEVAEGPELETEWFNFDALNLPPDHPARSMADTLWIEPAADRKCLRTQTSPVQVRTMLERREPPIYVVSPGKVFRADEYDATHLPVFHQIEGLCIDKGITMAHLRGTLDHFARAMFGDVRTRMRPHYFPFTEPSAEVDLECFVCHGASVGNPDAPCRTCRSEGWIEWGGCGVVNPRVLRAAGIDPDVYTGFAFGMGVDRTVMFRNSATDLRDFVEGDIRFSRSLVGGAR